jgi:hypothetical protein
MEEREREKSDAGALTTAIAEASPPRLREGIYNPNLTR